MAETTRQGKRAGNGRAGTGAWRGTAGSVRCAIYTRKSSEEGLEQDFNSLDAQREACEAFVLSQKHEGWSVLPGRFDDGGFSGGSMERPALQGLLESIGAGEVDVVVVYKVDRLTRALGDFARIVETFDYNGVSFVSVTQQFNTTSSMGRLTLNVLLSFAQFEREVTGERIRDKIAASKKKGMWMGGFVPLGYQPKDRSLVIDEEEAETVKALFRLYLRLGTVREVQAEAEKLGLRSKLHRSANGKTHGGVGFSRGAIYKILSNPVYVGEIVHKGERYPGTHPAIIDPKTWERVQEQLQANAARKRRQETARSPSLLAGLVVDEAGEPLTPSHACKKGRRYRYYVSRALLGGRRRDERGVGASISTWRLPANEIETLVTDALAEFLRDRIRLVDQLHLSRLDPQGLDQALFAARQLANELEHAADTARRALFAEVLERVAIGPEFVTLSINALRLGSRLIPSDAPTARDHFPEEGPLLQLTLPMHLARGGTGLKLVLAERTESARPDRSLVLNLARGLAWAEELRSGATDSLAAIAKRENLSPAFIRRCCDLAFLPSDVTDAIAEGRQPTTLTSEALKRFYPLPVAWLAQRRLLLTTERPQNSLDLPATASVSM